MNNVKLNKFFKYGDCLTFDGLYSNTLNEVIKKYNNIDFNINEDNFIYPVRKQKNIELTQDEDLFNKHLGGYRSIIETITKFKTYNLQLKLACLLLNIKKFVEIGNIDVTYLHKRWTEDNFDFPDTKINVTAPTVSYKISNIQKIRNYQNELFTKIIYENNNLNNNTNCINDDLHMTDLDNKNDECYEVSYIIEHKINIDNSKEYYVKWKGYNKNSNSWVKETDFNSKDIIEQYWNTII
ncbi:hypothetical protein BC941DRAFT_363916 [Chlamydoabsidia padenii]|nr:hypothetical protein BC941DRAFT_364380 [Chlamydoabsidia padenii]KAI8327755.1 hypothetical protein BC941DRAFT_364381 [Chlamydoabsidia padenii]KAI8328273.1 hypothetical protein BC941DRAFT_363916 [Chlamydoabsidia padenii]